MSSDKINEQETTEAAAVETEGQERSKRCGNTHLSTVLSVIALLLAGYAIATASSSKGIANLENRLGELDSRVSSNSNQLAALSADVQQNRNSLIQARLKEVLLSIQEISGMADEQTQRSIAEAEKILLSLTASDRTTVEPAVQTPAENTAVEEVPESQPQVEGQVADETPAVDATADTGGTEAPADTDVTATPEEQSATETTPDQGGEAPAGDAPAQPL